MTVERSAWRRVGYALAVILALGAATPAGAQSLRMQVESRDIYAGLPFVLSLSAEGFDEEPEPAAPDLEIDGCRVTFLGVSPSTQSFVQIINGRQSSYRKVAFVYRYRVEAPEPGQYQVPPLTLTQGTKSASAAGGTFQATEVPSTRDMRIRLTVPERPVWVGETFEVTLDWYLRSNPGDQTFVVPLFDAADLFQVEAPPVVAGARTLKFQAGARDLELPYDSSKATVDGSEYTRFRFRARVTAERPGARELGPTRVVARLESGARRDAFGFRVPQHELFKAEDERRRLSVRALPAADRPASFTNAIGSAFSIRVEASRTVVQVGDPIDLQIEVRGDGRLEGLTLPRLDVTGGLPAELFSVPEESPPGEIDAEGRVKTFRVTVRLRSAEAREVPTIPFAYFDPQAGEYRTVASLPIALQVTGSAMVGAADVVGVERSSPAESAALVPGASPVPGLLPGSMVGADLALSAPERTLARSRSLADLRPLLLLLYGAPLIVFALRVWWLRTHAERGRSTEVRSAVKAAERALAEARRRPAREAAPELLARLRSVARLAGADGEARATLERIETEAYNPKAASEPLAAPLIDEARAALLRWRAASPASPPDQGKSAGPAVAAALAALLLSPPAPARAVDLAVRLDEARAAYGTALAEQDRVRRTRAFREAANGFAAVVEEHPSAPELLTDWGSAALGAQDIGHATLAFRRALALDPTHARARKNLAWVRSRLPAWLPRPAEGGAVDLLLFWRRGLSLADRHLLGAAAFALAVILLTPWSARRAPALRRLAVLPLALWLTLTGSALADGRGARGAVSVADGETLRSADSDGAPAALSSPLPAGAEVRLLETRGSWARVELADGTVGWLRAHAVEPVAR